MDGGSTGGVAPLVTRWPEHGDEELAAVARVLASGKTNYWTGTEGQTLEDEWRRLTGVQNILAVSNGTQALECALRGLGLPELSERYIYEGSGRPRVIVPARTFVATASAVHNTGGDPALADIDPETLCVTAETLEAAWAPGAVGVIVVHYGGLPVPGMDEIVRWAMRRGVWIVEDAAHAHGAPRVGLMSHAVAWSMCAGKILSTGGEGGLVGCLDRPLAERMRAYRDHGRYQLAGRNSRDMSGAGAAGHAEFTYCVDEPGSNLRMTEMQAAIGRVQLRGLGAQIARRREIAAAYDDALGSAAMFTPEQRAEHVRYLYHVRCERGEKTRAMTALNERGIPARFGGCDNIGKEPGFVRRGWNAACPGADLAGETTYSLPLYPTMSGADVERVCAALREVV